MNAYVSVCMCVCLYVQTSSVLEAKRLCRFRPARPYSKRQPYQKTRVPARGENFPQNSLPKPHRQQRSGDKCRHITGVLYALLLYYCADLINTGSLPATCWHYRHAGNVVAKFCISSTSHRLLVALRHVRKKFKK